MSIGPPIPGIQLFQNLTLKNSRSSSWERSKLKVTTWVQHSVDSHPFVLCHSSKSQCGSNVLSTQISFIPYQSDIPFLSYDFFQIWKSRVNVMSEVTVRSHNVGLASHRLKSHSFVPYQSGPLFLRYSIIKIWPWKSRVKVMREVTVQSHNLGL